MSISRMIVPLAVLAFAAVGRGQIVYEPVRYQYSIGSDYQFYYAGRDARVFDYAARDACAAELDRHGVPPAAVHTLPPSPQTTRVFSDCIPFRDGRIYSLTADDIRNEAYARAPRYIAKRDLLRSVGR